MKLKGVTPQPLPVTSIVQEAPFAADASISVVTKVPSTKSEPDPNLS